MMTLMPRPSMPAHRRPVVFLLIACHLALGFVAALHHDHAPAGTVPAQDTAAWRAATQYETAGGSVGLDTPCRVCSWTRSTLRPEGAHVAGEPGLPTEQSRPEAPARISRAPVARHAQLRAPPAS